VLADLFALTHGALRAMRQVAQGLEIKAAAPPHAEADLDAAERFVHEALALLEKPSP
jgi:adenylosuccinate lyase